MIVNYHFYIIYYLIYKGHFAIN